METTRFDLTGQRFGRLTVIRFIRRHRQGPRRWHCQCDCGKNVIVRGDCLRYGFTKSCGCLRAEVLGIGQRMKTHGDGYGTPEYRAWANMKDRCLNPRSQSFHNYGGRGIKVCERWMKYENFLADMGRRPSVEGVRYTLDRYPDNDGDYEPSNCRWATYAEQLTNRRYIDHGAHLRGRKLSAKTRRKISKAITQSWARGDHG